MRYGWHIAIFAFIAGAACVHYLFPRIEQQTVTNTQVKTEYKVRTEIKTVELPGGRKETVTIVQDNSTKSEQAATSSTVYKKPQYLLSLSAGSKLEFKPIYGLQAQRRIFGPIFAGLYARTDGEAGLLASWEF
jgi:hypothetical protein